MNIPDNAYTVAVCGGRHYANAERVDEVLTELKADTERRGYVLRIATGDATGADHLAGDWAREHQVPYQVFHANWQLHGRAAGPLRNRQLLEMARPKLVLAFPGGIGTNDMIRQAFRFGIETWRVFDDDIERPLPPTIEYEGL